eukprot:m.96534 g.96534  ORF g.96534 m.96534 type:complete len:59 (-) comp26901_c0_seq1:177-353(-)
MRHRRQTGTPKGNKNQKNSRREMAHQDKGRLKTTNHKQGNKEEERTRNPEKPNSTQNN